MRELNLLNGDCAADGWRGARRTGEFLVWRENYLQGILPGTENVEKFNRVRARELHRIAPEYEEAAIAEGLGAMHQTLLQLNRDDHLKLWFDFCPFDRAMLARILDLIARHPSPPGISLIAADVAWDREAFARDWPERLLSSAEIAAGAQAWHAYRDGAPAATLLDDLLQ